MMKNKINNMVFQVVSADLAADLETPVSVYLKLRSLGATFLLESAEKVDRLGRYSFIGFTSGRNLISHGNQTVYHDKKSEFISTKDPLETVKSVLAATTINPANDQALPDLLGAAVGSISYDYIKFAGDIPGKQTDDKINPVCQFTFVESLIVFDHLMRKMTVFSLIPDDFRGSFKLHDKILNALETPLVHRPTPPVSSQITFKSNTSTQEYGKMVEKAKHYIYEGDSFQIVLSRQVTTEYKGDSFEIYRHLRITNPSPYMFYLDFGSSQIIGSSPEVMVKLTGDRAFISPIAGTRHRSTNNKKDQALATELMADEKDRAEHTMLVDLARNDLGRVCKYGSVKMTRFMHVERYSHVMHIVSDIHGELSDDSDQFDLFRATFPAGTVSGAPKIRSMQIIEELEKGPRGIYAGSVGYFSPSGNMDTCIAIRTVCIENGIAYLQAGAGIVADSDPEKEFVETENKLAALKIAVKDSRGEKK